MDGLISVDEELPYAQRLEIDNTILHGGATKGDKSEGGKSLYYWLAGSRDRVVLNAASHCRSVGGNRKETNRRARWLLLKACVYSVYILGHGTGEEAAVWRVECRRTT